MVGSDATGLVYGHVRGGENVKATAVLAWLLANPMIPGFLVFFGLFGIARLPPPKNKRFRLLWSILARAMFTTWDVWGASKLKIPGTLSPRPPWEDNPNWPDDAPQRVTPVSVENDAA